jgi:hypothetical protein
VTAMLLYWAAINRDDAREDHGIRISAVTSVRGASLLPRMIEPADHYFLHRCSQHMSEPDAEALRILRSATPITGIWF